MTAHDDDWLARALRAHEPRIEDRGFTQRVMAALPPAPAPRVVKEKDWIVLTGAATGSAIAASQFPLEPFLRVLVEAAQITWIGAALMLACMAGVLLAEPVRRAL